MSAIDDFETFRSNVDMVYLTLHNPLHDIPTDEEFETINRRTEEVFYAALHALRRKFRTWKPTSSNCALNISPIRFNVIDDYYPPPFMGPKNEAKFKLYMISIRKAGLMHLRHHNSVWLKNTRQHHAKRLENVLDIYCNQRHSKESKFQNWERYWVKKYLEEHAHMAEINVLSAIPTFEKMADFLDDAMFLHRTVEPIPSTGSLFDTIVCFQRYMSKGYFKKPKSRFLLG